MSNLFIVLLKKLIDPTYLFYVDPLQLHRSDKIFFAFGAVAIVVAIVFKLAALYAPNPIDKTLRQRCFSLFFTTGMLEVFWLGARLQNIRFFGSHFVALLILLIGLVWAVKIIVSAYVNYRKDRVSWEKEQVKLKYLPK